MRKIIRFLVLIFAFGAKALLGYTNPNQQGFSVIGEFLYLYPSVDDTYFVLESPTQLTVTGERKNNDFNFHPGFRIGAIYAFCNQEIQVYYSRLHAKQNKTIDGISLSATRGSADLLNNFAFYEGSAASSLNLHYDRVDGFFVKHLYGCGDSIFSFKAGLEYAKLHLDETYTYLTATTSGIVDQRSHAQGIGPQIGLDFDYYLWSSCNCPSSLSFAIYASGSILASKTTTSETDTFIDVFIVNPHDEATWRLIPAFHARAGLNYDTSFSCLGISLEVGYEFNTYIRGVARDAFPTLDTRTLELTEYFNFDVQGLYVGAAVAF